MGANSGIEWCDHTFNPWWGCIRVSPGCERCYAETFAHRMGLKVWGPAKTTQRRPASDSYWREPVKWEERARKNGQRARVFCASMADVFEDHPQVEPWRERLFELIWVTPNLDWLLLTKRPENMVRMAPVEWDGGWPANVWAGTSVEDQQRADERIPHLLRVPAAVRFLSCEPLLGPVDLHPWLEDEENEATADLMLARPFEPLDWVIVGGESGPGARPMDVSWARSLVQQCRDAGAPCFVKQLGADPYNVNLVGMAMHDRKGGDPAEWPADLRVRQFPEAARV